MISHPRNDEYVDALLQNIRRRRCQYSPTLCRKDDQSYKKDMNEVLSWCYDNLEVCQDNCVPIKDIYERFVCDENVDADARDIKQKNFTTIISRHYAIEKRRWKGSLPQSCLLRPNAEVSEDIDEL